VFGEIEINFQKSVNGISAGWVCGIIAATLKREKKKGSLSVLLTDNKNIRKINKQFLGHDTATDVISFWLEKKTLAKNETGFLGELVVSHEMAKQLSRELGISFKEELGRYLIHGTLHLLGYDDKKEKDHMKMHRRQEFILRKVL